MRNYELAPIQEYKYLQIKHALSAESIDWAGLSDNSPLEGRVLVEEMTSKAFSTLINNRLENLHKLGARWEVECGPLEDIDWEATLMHPREIVIKASLRLIKLKMQHRVYYDRSRLFKIGRAQCPQKYEM